MKQYLAEGAIGGVSFFVDRSKPVVFEAHTDGTATSKIPGRFSICDCINGNNRRYSKRVWEKNLQQGSVLTESIKRNAAFGLLEHPKDGIVTLLSPISHHITDAKMVEARDQGGKIIFEVHGTIEILETPEGKKLRALIEGGYNPLVSSRGYGSLQKATDGVDEVCEDYVCEGWDVVIKPSFETAELTPQRAPAPALAAESKPVQAAAVVETAPKTLKESPSTGAVTPAASAPQNTSKTMELTEIKSRIAGLRATTESANTDPKRFAETVALVEELHQEAAQWGAADSKRAWDTQKVHRDLDEISTKLSESAAAPSKQAKKLSENNGKLMKVINAVAQTAVTYKKKLGEALKKETSSAKMIEQLIRRGQGWQQVAESRKQKLSTLEEDFNTSCEALDIMRDRYHEDVTELGRRVIVLEFKEKAQAPEIQKQLKEATRLRHIAAIRETLEGKKPVTEEDKEGGKTAGVGKPKDGENATMVKKEGQGGDKGEKGEQVAKEPGKVTNESKDGKPAPVTEGAPAPLTENGKILLSTRDPRGITESFEMVRRLSTTAK
jgi:hypothetical protein